MLIIRFTGKIIFAGTFLLSNHKNGIMGTSDNGNEIKYKGKKNLKTLNLNVNNMHTITAANTADKNTTI